MKSDDIVGTRLEILVERLLNFSSQRKSEVVRVDRGLLIRGHLTVHVLIS